MYFYGGFNINQIATMFGEFRYAMGFDCYCDDAKALAGLVNYPA
jgi:hypothetical protein